MSGDVSGWVAAAAAAAAAVVVAWQAWETRRAAQASRDAVVTANAALELSRQQAAEAVRARIDAATPRISVVLPGEPTWPPLEPSMYFGGHPQPLPVGVTPDPMRMPRDKAKQILVRTRVTIINESDSLVKVDVDSLTDDAGAVVASPVSLDPASNLEAWFAVTRSLEQWIEVYRARQTGQSGVAAFGTVNYMDLADTGVADRWELELSGTPVEPVADMDGSWQLINAPDHLSGRPGAIGLGVPFRKRVYYLSKTKNERLPD